MKTETWWAELNGISIGPMVRERLQDLIKQGRVDGETRVSRDRSEWVAAKTCSELFPTDGTRQDEPPATKKPAFFLYPIIRTRKRLFRTDVVAIYETHLIKGARYFRSVTISDAMCDPSGEAELVKHLWLPQRLSLSKGMSVWERTQPWRKTGTRPPINYISKFQLWSSGGYASFKLLSWQARNVRTALAQISSPDNYMIKMRSLGCFVTGMVFLFAAFFILMGYESLMDVIFILSHKDDDLIQLEYRYYIHRLYVDILTLFIFGLPALCLLFYMVRLEVSADRNWMSLTEFQRRNAEIDARKRKKLFPKARRPFRSRWLGWTLKLLGIAYALVILSPRTDGLAVIIKNLFRNNPPLISWIWTFIWAPGPYLILLGYKLCLREYRPSQRKDSRPPIVFLRPFEEDAAISLQPAGLLAVLCGIRSSPLGSDSPESARISPLELITSWNPIRLLRMIFDRGVETAEESIASYFESRGPVIAIGRPGELLATPGSRRMYLDDATWQETILAEFKGAQAVVMIPGASEGVRWELAQMRENVDPRRVLLCLVNYWKNPEEFDAFAHVLSETIRIDLPRNLPFLPRPFFLCFDKNWTPRLLEVRYKNPILWPLTGDATDLKSTLLPFITIREKMDNSENPIPPADPGFTHSAG